MIKTKRHSRHLKRRETKTGAVKAAGSRSEQPPDNDESAVFARAVEVIGDEREAMRWMGTPVRALEYATPISLLYRPKGRRAVIAILSKLEHGVL